LRVAELLEVKPMPIGTAKGLAKRTPVIVAGHSGAEAAQAAVVVSRRTFAGYWEYLLEDAIFTAPPCPARSGAVLIAPDGKLARPWLGANFRDLDGQLVVRRVAPKGPAAAGIQHGDRVVALDGS
jgi:predicted metalloprotease with PDZ domain